MDEVRPTLFIGSSTEALKLARTLKDRLAPVADVTLWTDDSYKKPGEFFLDSLVAAPSRYDFALLLFGKDDKLILRGKTQTAPRDNVVFELGLFLPALGRERTLVLVPESRRGSYRILSDLQGLTLWEYPPDIEEVCAHVSARIRELGHRRTDNAPGAAFDLAAALTEAIREGQRSGEPVVVENIALDMESTWPLVRDRILADRFVRNVTWRSIMVDADSLRLKELWSDTVSMGVARNAESNIRSWCEGHRAAFEPRQVAFQCRAYAEIPTVHGFLFNKRSAFLSLCAFDKDTGVLLGAPNPYIRVDSVARGPRSGAAEHLVAAFASWFDYHWAKGSRAVWPA